jgi:hypothetical protein
MTPTGASWSCRSGRTRPCVSRALQCGPVYCSLHHLPGDVKARLHTISPNVPLVFDRWSIDPYRDRFEVTLHNDGTIRGIGGVRVVNADCATSVPGLFVAGDNASREKVAGAISGGGRDLVSSRQMISFAPRGRVIVLLQSIRQL